MGKRLRAKARTDCLMCGWIKEGVVEAATEEDIAAEAHRFHKEHGQLIGAMVLRGGLIGDLSRSAKILPIAAKIPVSMLRGFLRTVET